MTQIDKSKPVMVTGATGYVAGWLVKKLLETGHTVHAAVRNPDNHKKLEHLNEIAKKSTGDIKYFKADLLEKGSYTEAMKDCELVFHTASPFSLDVKDAQKQLIEPAVLGTENVLNSASATPSVKRVVVTSSVVATLTDAIDCTNAPNGIITEDIWNTTASLEYQPYAYSKTLAEKKAWEMMESQSQWDLVTINPSFVMGPPLNLKTNSSESMSFLKQIGDGSLKSGVPKMGMGMVDVRDVAEAHFRAGFTPEAKGRYITSGHNTNFLEIGQKLQPKYGQDFPLPTRAMPKWLIVLVGPFVSKLFTRRYLRNNVNIPMNLDNSKIKKDLGMTFQPLQKTMEDGFQVLIDEGVLKKK